jgi:hypothetical protein
MKRIVSILTASMLLLSMILIVPMIHAEGPAVWTDKADYVPEETVTIYGSGFDSVVSITVTRPNGDTSCWDITPDSGSFTTYYQLDGVEGTYIVDATDGVNTATTTFTDNGQAGTTLSATVSVCGHWTITYAWTIDKSVTPDTWEFHPGDSGTSTYTITVTKDAGTEEAWVEGTVCVTNGGAVATENLAITAELKDGYAPPNDFLAEVTVDVSMHPVLGPGETYCYGYRVDIPITDGAHPQPHAGGAYKVTAHVTITNHSGHLGTPFGPNPSTESFEWQNSPTLINNEIHVDDTNGGSWTFSASGSVNYDKTFVYCEEGKHENTATIRETGQFDKAVVTVTCIKPSPATICGVKYYDTDLDGERDGGEIGLACWWIELWKLDGTWTKVDEVQTGSAGAYCFEVYEDGTYKVEEVGKCMWVQTGPTSLCYQIEVVVGNDYCDNDFGNVKLMCGRGGLTLGFWSNKNGQALITTADVNALNEEPLYTPTGWAYPPFNGGSLNSAKTQIKNYLLSATAVDMRWMLSAQLIATKLDVLHGYLSESTMVYVGTSPYVPFPGFVSIGEIISNADLALGGTDRCEQEYWKNLLDGLNNNRFKFLAPPP